MGLGERRGVQGVGLSNFVNIHAPLCTFSTLSTFGGIQFE